MKVALYARVSTKDQKCEVQLRELREYVERRGWEPATKPHDEYVDTGFSGSKASRPALDRLMVDAKLRRFDCILVWKLDRFGRSVLHLSQQLDELDRYGVRFMAVSQGIDTDQSNPMSRFMLQILAAVAQFERELIKERTLSGLHAAKASGKKLGRRRKVFDRAEALKLRANGQSWRTISKALGIPVSTVVDACTEMSNRSLVENTCSEMPI
jgi:DNA invertase Pin-like site-specific DNA recombinase